MTASRSEQLELLVPSSVVIDGVMVAACPPARPHADARATVQSDAPSHPLRDPLGSLIPADSMAHRSSCAHRASFDPEPVQKALVAAPFAAHPHVQVQEHLAAELSLELAARGRADLL